MADVQVVTERSDRRRARRVRTVALVVGQLNIGGTERQVALLAGGLQARGVEVAVAVLWEQGIVGRELQAAGVPVSMLGFPKRGAGARFPADLAAASTRYVRWLRRLQPDIHHTFLPTAYLVVTPLARPASDAILIQSRRSLRDHIRGFTRPERGFAAQARYLAVRGADQLSVRLTDHFVANADAVAANALALEHIDPGAMSVIPNGVRPEFFDVAPAPCAETIPDVTYVANFHAYKGHDELLTVTRRLTADGFAFTMTLVGDGIERPTLEARAAAEGLPIRFLGQRTDIADVLRGTDIVVHPSRTEGLSNSILEAMAAGRPVIATDAGGTREAIGEAGIVVPIGDTSALEAALRNLLSTPTERNRLGRLARQRAVAQFSADAMVERYVDLYDALIEARGGLCAG